jgi:hypothetical protein
MNSYFPDMHQHCILGESTFPTQHVDVCPEVPTGLGFSCDWALWSLVVALNYCGLKTVYSSATGDSTHAVVAFSDIKHTMWLLERCLSGDPLIRDLAQQWTWEISYLEGIRPFKPLKERFGGILRFPIAQIELVTDAIINTLVSSGVLSKTMFDVESKRIDTSL